MQVVTESGSHYYLTVTSKGLLCQKDDGWQGVGVAIYPDRLPFLLATDKVVVHENGLTEGFNANGSRTVKLELGQVRRGMVLANRRGFVSTKIVRIIH